MSLAILFHSLCAQHVSDINISIIKSLRLFCWITTSGSIVLGSMCVGVSACNTDTTPTQPHRNCNTHRTKNNTTNVVIQQNSRKLLKMGILRSETCWAHKNWNKIASDIKLVFYSSTLMRNFTNRSIDAKSKDRKALITVSKEWVSLGRFSWNSQSITKRLWTYNVLNFIQIELTFWRRNYFLNFSTTCI